MAAGESPDGRAVVVVGGDGALSDWLADRDPGVVGAYFFGVSEDRRRSGLWLNH